MSQQEGATDYKYEDYASEMALHRLPQTAVLVNKKMKIALRLGDILRSRFHRSQQGYLAKRQRARDGLVRGVWKLRRKPILST